MTNLASTIALADASGSTWDAIVIGAGPAGSFAALGLARAGLTTLLVERKAFPRHKVCGGCLNAQALALLASAGLADGVRALGARPLEAIQLRYGRSRARLALPASLAVTRAALDAFLVRAAISDGCAFLSETTAALDTGWTSPEARRTDARLVTLQHRTNETVSAAARVVVVADGLGHSSWRGAVSAHDEVEPDARVGVGAVAEAGCVASISGAVTMIVGRGGYVGMTEVEDHRVNIAAALDVDFLKAQGGPARSVRAILKSVGETAEPALDQLDWLGTLPLTRHVARPVAQRVFVLGDAAGYIEPFTGEGMAWALAAAQALVPIVKSAAGNWSEAVEQRWLDAYDRIVRQNQRWCRTIARALRYPALLGPMVATLSSHPGLAGPLLARVAPGAASHAFEDRR